MANDAQINLSKVWLQTQFATDIFRWTTLSQDEAFSFNNMQ